MEDPELPDDVDETLYYMFDKSAFQKSNSVAEGIEVKGQDSPSEVELQALVGPGGLLSSGSFAGADLLGEREQASLAEVVDGVTNAGQGRKALKVPKQKKDDSGKKGKSALQSLMAGLSADAAQARKFAAALGGFGISPETISRLSAFAAKLEMEYATLLQSPESADQVKQRLEQEWEWYHSVSAGYSRMLAGAAAKNAPKKRGASAEGSEA